MLNAQLLRGERVHLTPLAQADALTMAGWGLDLDYLRHLDAEPAFPRTEQQVLDWMREHSRGREDYLFGIRLALTDELIGFVELGEIAWTHRTAWLALGIGEGRHRRRGYGTEALRLALDYAFNELNLYRLQLTVFAYNHAAIALYEKLGWRREGVFREALQRDGQRHDIFLYGLLAREWLGRDDPP